MGVENVVVGPAFGSGLEDGIVAGVAGLTGLAGGFSADRKGLRAMIRGRGQDVTSRSARSGSSSSAKTHSGQTFRAKQLATSE